MNTHPTHITRLSDSSFYDEICVLCGATDGRTDDRLERPCPENPLPPEDAALQAALAPFAAVGRNLHRDRDGDLCLYRAAGDAEGAWTITGADCIRAAEATALRKPDMVPTTWTPVNAVALVPQTGRRLQAYVRRQAHHGEIGLFPGVRARPIGEPIASLFVTLDQAEALVRAPEGASPPPCLDFTRDAPLHGAAGSEP